MREAEADGKRHFAVKVALIKNQPTPSLCVPSRLVRRSLRLIEGTEGAACVIEAP